MRTKNKSIIIKCKSDRLLEQKLNFKSKQLTYSSVKSEKIIAQGRHLDLPNWKINKQ